jgi:hypothetical protein
MAEARLAAQKGKIDRSSSSIAVCRSIVRSSDRQVAWSFRIGSVSQNKGLINRRN